MPFQPDKISKQNVLDAVKKIEEEKLELNPSTGFDVIINGKPYPPKEVMRLAHEKMNGEKVWRLTGGEPTNKYLSRLGFEIRRKEEAGYYLLGAVWSGQKIGEQDQVIKFLREGIWENNHEDKFLDVTKAVNIGDRVAIKSSFATGKISKLRIKALGTVTENQMDGKVLKINWDPPFIPFDIEGYGSYRTTIQKLTNPDHIESIFGADIKVAKQIEDSLSEESLIRVLRKIGQKDAANYFASLELVVKSIGVEEHDERLVFSLRSEKRLAFTIGQRYCLSYVIKKELQWGFILTNSERFMGNVIVFPYEGPVEAYYYESDDYRLIEHERNGIIEACRNELSRTNKSSFSKNGNDSFQKAVFDENYRNRVFNKAFGLQQKNVMNLDLNTILYGPPGTGKTYSTVSKAISIANPEFNLEQEREIVKSEFDRLMQDGQIVFTTFHQSMSYEDFIEGIKPIEPKEGDAYLKYEIQNGILKDICERIRNFEKITTSNLPAGRKITNYDQLYSAFLQRLNEIISELDENEFHFFESRRSKVKLIRVDGDNIVTIGETANDDEVVTKDKLKRIYDKFQSVDEITNIVKQLREVGGDIGWTTNFFAVFKALKEFEASIKTVTAEDIPAAKKKNYVLIIDEINRGNISQIFGELITLIEEDKRIGNDESLEVTLPYSKKKFGLPSNLYLIGTMNTADRSVEALDAALRRRFSFEEMPPVPQLIINKGKLKDSGGKILGIDLAELLGTINKRIEKLLDKDHLIGHSYFMSVKSLKNLQEAFQNKINPLLQEYFFGDFGKIGLVLGGGFFENEGAQTSENLFADFDGYESSDLAERSVYRLRNVLAMTSKDFIAALKLLMNK